MAPLLAGKAPYSSLVAAVTFFTRDVGPVMLIHRLDVLSATDGMSALPQNAIVRR
jgi:hypothetical protein